MKIRWVIVAAFLLLLLAVVVVRQDEVGEMDLPAGQRVSGKSERPPARDTAGTRSMASKTGRTLPEGAAAPTHTAEQLKDFIIPDFSVRDATLEEALAILFAEYHRISTATGEQPVPFRYTIHGTPAGSISVSRSGSFLSLLSLLAVFSRSYLDRLGSHLVFTAAPGDSSAPMVTRSLKVPPTLASGLAQLQPREIDPFVDHDPADLLRALDLIGEESFAAYEKATSTLVVNASDAEHRRLSLLVDEVLNEPPVLYKNQHKIIESPVPLTLPTAGSDFGPDSGGALILDNDQMVTFLRDAIDRKGADIVTAPSVVARHGQNSTIENVHEHIIPTEYQGDTPTEFQADWTGQKANITMGGYGFANRSSARFASRERLEEPEGATPPNFQTSIQQFQLTLPEGQAAVMHTEQADGTHRYIVVEMRRVDPAGAPVTDGP